MPIYIFQGLYDRHTITDVVKDYIEAIDAPDKHYYGFENSAHWPHLNEFEKYKFILTSIVNPVSLDANNL